MGIGYEQGLWAFVVLIPFFILYLIRPHHRKVKIPSLMFLLDEKKSFTQLNFLRNLLKDPLFIVQLLLLLALAYAVAEPFIMLPKAETATNTVLIFDASASSQAESDGKTRFQSALDKAGSYLQGKISIILASQVPEVVLENGGRMQASGMLSALKPFDTTTNIAGAMFLAKDILAGNKGQAIVFSDFVTTSPEDNILVAKRALNAKGVNVDFISTHSKADNMGIVGLDIRKDSFRATVKNYGAEPKEVELQLSKDSKVEQSKRLKIAANSVESASFPTLPGVAELKLDAKDSFLLDNIAFISSPLNERIYVLMLTNDRNNFVKKALEAANLFEVEVREPPIVKAFELSQDIIIITDVAKTIVPSDIIDIKKYIQEGNTLVITAGESLLKLGLDELLPVKLNALSETSSVNVKIINAFTKDRDFGITAKHFSATPLPDSVVFAVAKDDSPMLAQGRLKEGTVFYYGIFDRDSEFKATEDYPIFWFTLLANLMKTADIRDFNFRISERPQFRKTGIIEAEGKKIAVNLLDEDESDISRPAKELEEDIIAFKEKSFTGKARYELSVPLLFAAIALVFLELAYVKWRGEL